MKKILFVAILTVIMNISFVFAKTYDLLQISQARLVTSYSDETTVDQMDTVLFGSYPQTDASGNTKDPIEWIVLDRQGDKTLLLSKYILDNKCYNNEKKDATWEICSLRVWLNNEFYCKAFNGSEQSKILTTNVINIDNSIYGTNGGKNTNDKIFCMSIDEVKKYFYQINMESDNKRLAARATDYAKNVNNDGYYLNVYWNGNTCFWLRSPGLRQGAAAEVNNVGHLLENGGSFTAHTLGVRPALWVDTSSYYNSHRGVSKNAQSNQNNKTKNDTITDGGVIPGLPSRESELRLDNHFYLDENMQRNSWVYYVKYYYHVDANGNIEKSKWIEQRYVGEDGRMYRGRQTPDGHWVGDSGLVVDIHQDLYNSTLVEAAESDSWYRTQSGLWYYFENDRTTTKKGWFKDKSDDQWYYLNPETGIMQVGWANIDGKYYYFNESHNNETNWYETGNGFFESFGKKVKAYGSMFKNEETPDGYWVNENGEYTEKHSSPMTNVIILLVSLFGLIGILALITATKIKKKNNTIKNGEKT